ncbi:tetratricopeptide repeat protein, partial [Bacteroides sp.]
VLESELAFLSDWDVTKKSFVKAFEIAEYGLKLHPDSTELMIEYAYLHLDNGKKAKAREIIENLPDTYSPEAKVVRAHLLLSEGKLDDAEQLLDTIEDKADLANVVDVSYMYLDMGYPDKALAWLDPVKEEYSDEEAYIAVVADCLYGKGMTEEAIPLYNRLIDMNPYSAPYWFGLARCHFEEMNFNQAIDACDYALVGDDEFADAYVMKGHCFYQLGNEDAALEYYQKAEELHGLAPEFIYTYIGLCKVSKGEWKEGYENLEKAILENETDEIASPILPSLYANAGLCLSKMGKKRKAHQYCKKAHKLSPEEPESLLIEGRIYIEEGDYDKGIKQWAKALNCSPTADTWNEIGMHSMEIGYLDYAKIAFERVCELEPDFDGINEKLTVLYMTLHDKENFIKYNQKCPRPFDLKELEKMQMLMESEDREDLAAYMQNIIKALQ